jgi:hypothetical protein
MTMTHGATVGARYGHTMPEYYVWKAMRRRCSGADRNCAHNYADRGIRVCERWQNDFAAFLADMGQRPTSRHTLERIDNEGHYEPTNCRWATRKEQLRNRRNNRYITFNGRTRTIAEWAEQYGMNKCALRQRVFVYGWPLHLALTTPTRRWRKKGGVPNMET